MQRSVSALLLGLALGCPSDDDDGGDHDAPDEDDREQRIVDMSGAQFLWTGTEVHRRAGVSPDLPTCERDERPEYRLLDTSRFAVVTGACVDGARLLWWGHDRIVVCEHDDECPHPGARAFECRAGLCQDADTTRYPIDVLTYPDMFELCFGRAHRVTDMLFSVDDYPNYPGTDPATVASIDAACDPGTLIVPCTGELPAGCIQPW